MLLKYFFDEKLAHASYLIGCQQTGEAAIIDPMRDIEPYINFCKREGLKIVGAMETHIHADFVSGSRELSNRLKSKIFISDEGDENWKYQNLYSLDFKLLKDGDSFSIGNLIIDVMHTPGHTPESISFLLTDKGVNDGIPIGVFTGDFVFVGDIGRPDLIEKIAGGTGTSELAAKQMFDSIKRFKKLPDFLQVWPAHGSGSACGRAPGALPSSTVGYEKRFNWAMQIEDEQQFITALLEGQPEVPFYFKKMKSLNKIGPTLVKDLPELKSITSNFELEQLIKSNAQIIDTRDTVAFSEGHIKGTINIPFNKSFPNWVGWLIDYSRPVYVLLEEEDLGDVLIALRSVGIDNVIGYGYVNTLVKKTSNLETYKNITPLEIEKMILNNEVYILDVRSLSEWAAGHIGGAQHIMLGVLPKRLEEIRTDKPILVQCASGIRSAIGASILQANGIKNVINLLGGFSRWKKETNKLVNSR
ncbi:rhodanese-like domain-containing protein [Rossellomorea aquimaris]|uniref:MBL fold metallo-hydrolase n=1 Tax=Rossellomorea aquimaris TaxID=189382 RepID=UPI0011E92655|nr:MBL fold metallo-hydrolase [Rossellomorea aquimaris]TYS83513.1 MBL fold metallo-hydrolase [Rossellomorea aquimaris]